MFHIAICHWSDVTNGDAVTNIFEPNSPGLRHLAQASKIPATLAAIVCSRDKPNKLDKPSNCPDSLYLIMLRQANIPPS